MVREGKFEDINNGLLKVYIEGYRYHQNGRPDLFIDITDEELEDKLKRDLEKNKFLVVLKDNEVVGYIMYEIKETKHKKIYINQIAVQNAYRKQGYGKLLIEELKKLGALMDCKKIELNCWVFNEDALAFYEHLGFEKQRITLDIKL